MPLYKIEEYINSLNKKTYVVKAKTKEQALTEFNTDVLNFSAEYIRTDKELHNQQQQVDVTPISKQQYNQLKKGKKWQPNYHPHICIC